MPVPVCRSLKVVDRLYDRFRVIISPIYFCGLLQHIIMPGGNHAVGGRHAARLPLCILHD